MTSQRPDTRRLGALLLLWTATACCQWAAPAASPHDSPVRQPAAGANPTIGEESDFWESSHCTVDNPAGCRLYLGRFSRGPFADVARARLAGVAALSPTVGTAVPPASADAHVRAIQPPHGCAPACPDMVALAAGSFMMGSRTGLLGADTDAFADETPRHSVTLGAFRISRSPITFEQWDACVEAGGCNGYRPDDQGWGRGQRPVINVSWQDANAYVHWVSLATSHHYALPSESQFEYAARAGTTTRYYWGDAPGQGHANCSECGSQWDLARTSPVRSFPANPWDLYDMSGNVWEWVQDCYHPDYRDAPADGSASTDPACVLRVMRGGSWVSAPRLTRSAARNWGSDWIRSTFVGFRVVQSD